MRRRAASAVCELVLAQSSSPIGRVASELAQRLGPSAPSAVLHPADAAPVATSRTWGSHQPMGTMQQVRWMCSPHPPGLGLAARARALHAPVPCQQQQWPQLQQDPEAADGGVYTCPACVSSCHQTALEQARTLCVLAQQRDLKQNPARAGAALAPPPPARAGGPHPQPPHSSAASLHTMSWTAVATYEDDPPTTLQRQAQQRLQPAQTLLSLLLTKPVALDVAALVPRATSRQGADLASTSAQLEATALATHVRWGGPTVLAVSGLAVAELLLLPVLAPSGTCFGSLAAESAFNLFGKPHSLAGLLQASQRLEWVQAFSFARKLGQLALLDLAIRWATNGKPHQVFTMGTDSPLDRQRGWAVWACHALVGLAVINLLQQSLDSALAGGTGAGPALSAEWLTGADERMLPFRCRWWLETCVAAPLLEETFFRGFLLSSLTKVMPSWGAVLGSSALFAVSHLGSVPLTSLPSLTALGCVLGFAFLRTRNLLAPLAAHSANNTAALLAASV